MKRKQKKILSDKQKMVQLARKRKIAEEHRKIIFADCPDVPV